MILKLSAAGFESATSLSAHNLSKKWS